MPSIIHTKNKPSAVATLRKESVDKPSAFGSLFMENETWKDIPNYEGLYKVSNLGRIKSFYFGISRILNPHKMTSGYYSIRLSKDKVSIAKYIHRLVAIAFIENPLEKSSVNHKNGVKTDNNILNLEWATHKENMHHAIKNGLLVVSGECAATSKLSDKIIIEIRTNKELNQRELAKKYNVHPSNISLIKNKKTRNNI